ncbi:MAG: hypothetical protein BJ554DRAFT_6241, partial [Olpidium bornovanus]
MLLLRQPFEFLGQAWTKEDRQVRAPNICRMAKWANHVVHWVVTEIVSVKELKGRISIYERFINLASHLNELNNFNGVKEILAALQSSASVTGNPVAIGFGFGVIVAAIDSGAAAHRSSAWGKKSASKSARGRAARLEECFHVPPSPSDLEFNNPQSLFGYFRLTSNATPDSRTKFLFFLRSWSDTLPGRLLQRSRLPRHLFQEHVGWWPRELPQVSENCELHPGVAGVRALFRGRIPARLRTRVARVGLDPRENDLSRPQIQVYQQTSYALEPVSEIQDYVR